MKIVIIGAGNIGSLLGALLVQSGQDVTLVELRDDVVNAIRNEGIRLDLSDGRKIQAKVDVTKDIHSLGTPDLIILAVKSYSTTTAAKDAKSVAGKDTWIMSVQNGAGNVEAITAALGADNRIIGGIFLCVVTPLSINHLSWVVGTGGLKIGPANGVMSPIIDQVADIFRKTGIDVVTSAAVQDLIWSKVLQNVPLGLATTLKITNDEFVAHPHVKDLIVKMAGECIAVARGLGVTLDHAEDPLQPLLDTLQKFHESGTKPKCSMLQDLEAGRKTEIDAINGSIVREGKRLGIPTPYNQVMVELVKAQEDRFCAPKGS